MNTLFLANSIHGGPRGRCRIIHEIPERKFRRGDIQFFMAAPDERQLSGMERVVIENESGALLFRETILDQRQVQILVPAIYFIPHDRMPEMGEVNS